MIDDYVVTWHVERMFMSDCSEWLKFRMLPYPSATIFQLRVKQWHKSSSCDLTVLHDIKILSPMFHVMIKSLISFRMIALPQVSLQSFFRSLLTTQREIQCLDELESQLTELEEFLEEDQLMTAVQTIPIIRQLLNVRPHLKLQLTTMIQVTKRLRDHFRKWNRIPFVDLQFIWIPSTLLTHGSAHSSFDWRLFILLSFIDAWTDVDLPIKFWWCRHGLPKASDITSTHHHQHDTPPTQHHQHNIMHTSSSQHIIIINTTSSST